MRRGLLPLPGSPRQGKWAGGGWHPRDRCAGHDTEGQQVNGQDTSGTILPVSHVREDEAEPLGGIWSPKTYTSLLRGTTSPCDRQKTENWKAGGPPAQLCLLTLSCLLCGSPLCRVLV